MGRLVVVCWVRRQVAIWVVGLACLVGLSAGLYVLVGRSVRPASVPGTSAATATVVVIDAGHGGVDPGAVGVSGLREKELVLGVALLLREELQRVGLQVHLTRDADIDYGDAEGTGANTRKRRDLITRVGIVETTGADLLVSIHANSFPDPIWAGAQTFFYYGRDEGRQLATAIQAVLVRDLGPNRREAKSADIFILKRSPAPAAMVEVGFLSNPAEEGLLRDDAYRLRLAKCIRAGIVDYLSQTKSRDDVQSGGEP